MEGNANLNEMVDTYGARVQVHVGKTSEESNRMRREEEEKRINDTHRLLSNHRNLDVPASQIFKYCM
jgi:cytosine/adenosine deaminase-related metal-dependent hydrolase